MDGPVGTDQVLADDALFAPGLDQLDRYVGLPQHGLEMFLDPVSGLFDAQAGHGHGTVKGPQVDGSTG